MGGAGVDVAVECAGNDRAVRSCLDALRRQGQHLQLGLLGRTLQMSIDAAVYGELRVTGSISSRDTSWRTAIELVRGRQVTPEVLVSNVFALEEWEIAFRAHEEKKGLKMLFRPE
jgi:L-iditol 2-dehydrogenase